MRRLALLLLFVITACDNPFGVDLPEGAVPFDPPGPYAAYYERVQSDAERSRDFASVQWFQVPSGPWMVEGEQVRAMWVGSGRRIYIASAHVGDTPLVMHEMLHDVLNDGDHSHPLFATEAYTSRLVIR